MADEFLADAPQSIGRVLDLGTRLYTRSFTRVVGLSLGAYLIFALAPLVLAVFDIDDVGAVVAREWTNVGLIIVAVVFIIAAYIGAAGLYFASLVRQWRFANDDHIPAADAFRQGLGLVLPAIAGGILLVLALIGGFLLLIIPGIYLSVALGLFYVVLVTERPNPITALRRSYRLVRGNWWRSATIITIPLVIIMALSVVVVFVPVFAMAFQSATSGETLSAGVELTINLLSGVVNGITVPWMSAIALTLYHDLLLRAEGGDLEQRMAVLEETD